jgi:hypothetical protein
MRSGQHQKRTHRVTTPLRPNSFPDDPRSSLVHVLAGMSAMVVRQNVLVKHGVKKVLRVQ